MKNNNEKLIIKAKSIKPKTEISYIIKISA